MNRKFKGLIGWGAIGAVLIAGIIFLFSLQSKPGELDAFAQCLKTKEATFYGAFWCPHCQDQKKMFGKSQKFLPYIECSTPDGKGQTALCREKGIEGYPTWEFADGSRESGALSLERLSKKTGCPLPQQ